jgi:NADH dehydrogenase
MQDQKHRVVVVGGGFGGLYAAKALRRAPVQVTLIDKRNFHLFQPLLYQVATGGLSPGDIASPLRWILNRHKNTEVILGEVTGIDVAAKEVVMCNGSIAYDTLIVATGAGHDYFGNNDWEQFAPGLKTVEDAIEIRSRIFRAFEDAERETDPIRRKRFMTFVIVGGGPTGVELAGALGEIAHDTLKHDFRKINPGSAQIILVEASDRILSSFPPALSGRAVSSLARLGVQVLTDHRVMNIDASGVDVRHANETRTLAAATVLWGAGVRGSSLGRDLVAGNTTFLDRAGRVIVNPDLTVPGLPDIFVIGDLVSFTHQTGEPLPGIAPVAMAQGRFVARAVVRRLQGEGIGTFHYFNKGVLATIGRAAAVADFGWVRVSGYPAWLLWLFVHLLYLVEFENRLLVLVQWAWSYLTFNRGARLITGEAGDSQARR